METEKFEIRSVTHRPGVITFEWDDTGDEYRVYKEGELRQEGPVCDYTDEYVKDGKMYHYAIERVHKDRTADVIMMQTSGFKEEKDAYNPLRYLVFTTIIAKSQVALSWEKIPGAETYSIFKNGELISETDHCYYIDREVPDERTLYMIRTSRPARKAEAPMSAGKSILGRIAGIFNPDSSTQEDVLEEFWISKVIGQPSKLLLPVDEWREPKPVERWRMRYTTFLEEKTIDNPNVLSPNRTFKGDGRSFDAEGASFRTRGDVTLSYKDPGFPLVFRKEAGRTVAYGVSGRKREEGTASIDDFTIEPMEHDGREFGFELKHSVGNPLTPAPLIDYEVHAILRRHGTFHVTGYHDQAPHHEVYLDKGDGWVPIHQAASKGLAHMSELIAYQHWISSNFE